MLRPDLPADVRIRRVRRRRRVGGPMRVTTLAASVVAWVGAALASLCCLLPLTVIVLGLGSGAFMATTMQYSWLLVPAGLIGIIAGFVLYLRERQRCDALACRMAGSRVTLALLILASLIVTTTIVLDRFPELTSDLLAHLMSGDRAPHGSQYGRDAMNRWVSALALMLALSALTQAASAATSTVVLAVEGMT